MTTTPASHPAYRQPDDHSLRGQTAIVTGGVRGIGLAIAQHLAAQGCRIALWDLDVASFDAGRAGFEPLCLQAVDIASLASVQAAFADTLAAAGQVEVLVNNAGIGGPNHPTWDYPPDQWQRVLDVNLNGVFHCCRTVLPHLRARGYGRVVNIASIAGKEGNANGSAYAAAKAGVIAYSKSIARELADSGVLVNCIAPAMAETELLQQLSPEFIAVTKAKIPMGRLLQPAEVAAMAAWIASPACSFTTGFTFDLSGGRATY